MESKKYISYKYLVSYFLGNAQDNGELCWKICTVHGVVD